MTNRIPQRDSVRISYSQNRQCGVKKQTIWAYLTLSTCEALFAHTLTKRQMSNAFVSGSDTFPSIVTWPWTKAGERKCVNSLQILLQDQAPKTHLVPSLDPTLAALSHHVAVELASLMLIRVSQWCPLYPCTHLHLVPCCNFMHDAPLRQAVEEHSSAIGLLATENWMLNAVCARAYIAHLVKKQNAAQQMEKVQKPMTQRRP